MYVHIDNGVRCMCVHMYQSLTTLDPNSNGDRNTVRSAP